MKRYLSIFLAVGIVALSVYFVIRVAPDLITKIGMKPTASNLPAAPDFILKDINGKMIKLSDLRGKVVIMYFWTSWNRVALEMLRTADEYNRYLPPDAALLTVNSLETNAVVEKIKTVGKLAAPILLDNEGEVGELYNITTLPLTVVIDKDGRETSRVVGQITLKDLENGFAAAKSR